ncbi:anthrone oxygenase family protein [Larsenimonas suaedae]|uniref:DUF1772 domain-containing protein n=1 Tax=Larsenimonas suaedae TaxID=1851019 RepID=A0ABU1GUD8_9GAMM|nr:anthrone oxygenase family protein [Larsenimonas suaedae]MCM2970914.1 DUF1772 domain-containing protein [Larsenimonas suaedae]MDR5895623.1 DUF1772 domain-containing protein [Larsenimonas suaedae]
MSSRAGYTFADNLPLMLAVMTTGLITGYFAMHWVTLQPAMMNMGADIYGTVQAEITHDLRNPFFLFMFFGGAAFLALSAAFDIKRWRSPSFVMTILALIVYLGGIVAYTKLMMVPINHDIQAWNPIAMPGDWVDIRALWRERNEYRLIAALTTFVLSIAALSARATSKPTPST